MMMSPIDKPDVSVPHTCICCGEDFDLMDMRDVNILVDDAGGPEYILWHVDCSSFHWTYGEDSIFNKLGENYITDLISFAKKKVAGGDIKPMEVER